MAPLPDIRISLYVAEPLPPSLLERIAAEGYICTNAQDHQEGYAGSEQAAE